MVALRINVFGGMIPAQDDRLLPDGGAALAENTWLYSGPLDGVKSPRFIRNLTDPAAKRVYRIPSDPYSGTSFDTSLWLEFQDIDVEVLRAPVRDDSYKRYYWVGPNTSPAYNTLFRISSSLSSYKLGIPQPGSAPGVTAPVTPDDTVAPVAASATVVGSLVTIVFTEERRMDSLNIPPTNAFRVTSPSREFEVTTVAVDGPGRKVGLLLSERAEANEVVTITYTDPKAGSDDKNALQDEAGNDVASFTIVCGNDTIDKTGPVFREARVDGTRLVIWFADANTLANTNLPAKTSFVVTSGGKEFVIDTIEIYQPDKAVILNLTTAIQPGAITTITYKDPTASNDPNAIQDTLGNDAPGFYNKPVDNVSSDQTGPYLTATSAINNIVNLKFGEKLTTNSPDPVRFAVTVNGTSYVPTQVNVDGNDALVVLTLPVTTAYGDIVTVTYNAANGTPVKILDLAGNGAYGWGVTTVQNQNTYIPTYDPNTGGGGGGGN